MTKLAKIFKKRLVLADRENYVLAKTKALVALVTQDIIPLQVLLTSKK